MYFFRVCCKMQSISLFIYIIIILTHINVQFCKASYQSSSFASASAFSSQWSSPEDCARECQEKELPKMCYYRFVLEYYTTNNAACDLCNTSTTTSGITSTCKCVIADGIEKTIFSINRMIPGPSIQVCKNDYVIIDVENKAEGLEASIHWHGIFQNGYQYYDGVPYLTQCPILSANTFRYQYKVKNSGTHFYHSHISVHMIDGQYGSLIVRDPPESNPHADLYDEDLPEHVIIISDWMHELSLERYPGLYRNNRGQAAENILINGRGNWKDPASGKSTNVPLSRFIIKSGKRYRFRMIDASSTICLNEITIEKHSKQLIATDGENVVPVMVDSIIMATGERVDFVLNANQPAGSYWMHVRGLGECEERRVYQLAILTYENGSELPLSPMPGYFFDSSERVFNPPNSTRCGIDLCVTQLEKIYLPGEEEINLKQQPDILLPMSFEFFDYATQSNLLFDTKNQQYKRFFVSPVGTMLDSLMNNISYQDSSGPPISQNNAYKFMCGDRSTPRTCTEPCTCTHVYNIRNHAVVDIMVYDKKPSYSMNLNHPFHLHGYSFCVLYAAQFPNANNEDEIPDAEVSREIYAHRRRLQNGSYKHCSPKDTMIVPNSGFIIIRFKADNPGWWFFHCHFLWHTATGMNVVLHVGEPYDLPPIPPYFPKCYNWTP